MQGFDQHTPERMTPQKRSELCYDLGCLTSNTVLCIYLLMENHPDRKEQVLREAKKAAEWVSRLLRDARLEAEGRPSSEYRARFLRKTIVGDHGKIIEKITPQERSDMCRNLLDCIEAVSTRIENGELGKASQLTKWVHEGVRMLLWDARMDAEGTPDYNPSL